MESLAETNDILKSNDTQEDEKIEIAEEVEDKEDIDDIGQKKMTMKIWIFVMSLIM